MGRLSPDKPCSLCHGPGPFPMVRKGKYWYYHSHCLICRKRLRDTWRAEHRGRYNAYAKTWAAGKRYQQFDQRLAHEGPSRAVLNYLGRKQAEAEGLLWCHWGMHAAPKAAFARLHSKARGYQYQCRQCQKVVRKLRLRHSQGKEGGTHGEAPAHRGLPPH